MGWQGKLQSNYSSFEEFVYYCDTYKIHKRLGYANPKTCWLSNPTVQGSVFAGDFRKVKS